MALNKLVYLATQNIRKKWTSPLQNWGTTIDKLKDEIEEIRPIAITMSKDIIRILQVVYNLLTSKYVPYPTHTWTHVQSLK